MDSSSYAPDIDTLLKYFSRVEAGVSDSLDRSMFNEIDRVLRKWHLPAERISDFYWIVTNPLSIRQSLNEALDKIAGMALSDFNEKIQVVEILRYARAHKKKISIKVKVGSKPQVTIRNSEIITRVVSYFKAFQKSLENEAKEKGVLIEDLVKSLGGKPDFVSEEMKRQIREICAYLRSEVVDTPTTKKYLLIVLLFSIAGQPFPQLVGRKKQPTPHTSKDFDEDNQIDTVKKLLLRMQVNV